MKNLKEIKTCDLINYNGKEVIFTEEYEYGYLMDIDSEEYEKIKDVVVVRKYDKQESIYIPKDTKGVLKIWTCKSKNTGRRMINVDIEIKGVTVKEFYPEYMETVFVL